MNRRERVFAMLENGNHDGYTPAAFFLHFDTSHHTGQPAIDKHLEYFRYTGMDIMKVQYEHHFPKNTDLTEPEHWRTIKPLAKEFFAEPLEVVKGVVKGARADAPVLVTLYSPFMFAAQISSRDILKRHLDEDPEAVRAGIDVVVESVLHFVRGCINAGIDGFYASTQGGESGFLSDPVLFERYVKPTDLAVWEVIDAECDLNILHICDYEGPYTDLAQFTDYPGDIVNSSLEFTPGTIGAQEIAGIFERPFMGGMDRHGALATGPSDAIRTAANAALSTAPERFLLAADCTVPGDTPWDNIRAAVDCAHGGGRSV